MEQHRRLHRQLLDERINKQTEPGRLNPGKKGVSMVSIVISKNEETGTFTISNGFFVVGECLAEDEVVEIVKELIKGKE